MIFNHDLIDLISYNLTMFTIIIACKNISNVVLKKNKKIHLVDEIICMEGNDPSEQRNKAARQANSDWLLFLDDDCELSKNILAKYKEFINNNRVNVVGGPALIRSENFNSYFFSYIFKSWFAFQSSRARYSSLGCPRLSTERELILCNMVINKDFFLKNNGFKPGFYPNEENEFLSRVDKNDVWYHPEAIVTRTIGKSYIKVIKKIYYYAFSRGKHVLVNFAPKKIIYLLPFLFVLLLIYGLIFPTDIAPVIIIYLTLDFLFSFSLARASASIGCFFLAFLTFPLIYIAYGIAIFIGIVIYLSRKYHVIK